MAELKVKRIRPGASIPGYATSGAAGLDLSAALDRPLVIHPGERVAIPTGLSLELPAAHEGQVRPRSGLALRHGVTVLNAPGTIDEDFRGEVRVLLINLGASPHVVHPGDRIAQLIVAPIRRVEVSVLSEERELSPTDRGSGGFGSTGVGRRSDA